MTKLRIVIPLLLTLVYILTTCKKTNVTEPDIVLGHGNPEVGNCLILEEISDFGTVYYNYDDDNRVSRITLSSKQYKNIFYNSDNRISKTEYYEDGKMEYYSLFEWSGTILTEKVFGVSKSKSFEVSKLVKKFDNNCRIQRINRYTENGLISYFDFKWENGNIIKKELWDKNTDFKLVAETVYEYDNMQNPKKEIYQSGLVNDYFAYLASQNNLHSLKHFDQNGDTIDMTTIEYRYGENNLPIWMKSTSEYYWWTDRNEPVLDSLTIEYNCN